MTPSRSLPKGMYTPLPTFFLENEDLDLESFASHVKYTAKAGTIPVVAGSAGEAPHLNSSERVQLIRTARSALESCEPSLEHVPIIAGVGAPSTRETIQLSREAAEAGADFVMVIPPGYYAAPLSANGGEALKKFFVDVAKASPCPVIVYNFPGVSGGIDLSSDLIVDVLKETDNVVGVKLT
jgi:4-hydroxy-2-oxoglutarate aldolase